jgi:hypothetical protein
MYFFLCEARADTHDVYHVALYYPNIGQVPTAECVKVLPFAFTLLFLLGQTSLAIDKRLAAEFRHQWMRQKHTLLLIDRLELANFVRVIPPARGALIVEVPPDVIPAESANL